MITILPRSSVRTLCKQIRRSLCVLVHFSSKYPISDHEIKHYTDDVNKRDHPFLNVVFQIIYYCIPS